MTGERFAAALMIAAVLPLAPLQAQGVEGRVGKLEKEVRALQRKVFPDGAGQYFQPQITPAPSGVIPGSPVGSPVADLTQRVDAIESQLRSMTGQIEQLTYRNRRLEEDFTRYRAEIEARLGGAAAGVSGNGAPAGSGTSTSAATSSPAPAPAASPAGSDRKAAVAAVERPSTGNAADDAYTYGFRLWDAKFYPEAQAQLKATVEKYPSSSIASRAQNLLGRAYMDDNKPNLAALAFRDSYEKWPEGDRAAESLARLGDSLIRLKKPADACKVYDVLESSYGAKLSPGLSDMMARGRTSAKCG